MEHIITIGNANVSFKSGLVCVFCKIHFISIFGFLHCFGLFSLCYYICESRDKNTGEDRDNGDYDDEFYDRKALFVEFFHC